MGDSSVLDGQADFADREVGRRSQDFGSGGQVVRGNLVTVLVQLCVPGKRAVWILGVLVSFHMAQDWHRVEGGKSIEDLHLDISFGKEGPLGDSKGELKRGLEPFQEALTVGISGEEEGRVSCDVEPPEVEDET
jgi:hypothetical protein